MNLTADPTKAAAGMKLLSKRHRSLHPRAQVQTLRRIAVRAMARADWMEELATQYDASVNDPEYTEEERASRRQLAAECRKQIPALHHKADIATQACLALNAEHHLGYGS